MNALELIEKLASGKHEDVEEAAHNLVGYSVVKSKSKRSLEKTKSATVSSSDLWGRRFKRKLIGSGYDRNLDDDDMKDIIQNTATKIWKESQDNIEYYRHADNPNALFYRLLDNEVADYLAARYKKSNRWKSLINPIKANHWRIKTDLDEIGSYIPIEYFVLLNDNSTDLTILSLRKNLRRSESRLARDGIAVMMELNLCVPIAKKEKRNNKPAWEDITARKLTNSEVEQIDDKFSEGVGIDVERRSECIKDALQRVREKHPSRGLALSLFVQDKSVPEIADAIGKTYTATTTFLSETRKWAFPYFKPCRSFISEGDLA